MARHALLNRIQDFQLEWATHFSQHSVRNYLIHEKGLNERQYRYIMSRAPSLEWKTRKEEIQNRVTAEKIQIFVDEAAKANVAFINASRLSSAKILEKLGTATSSQELLDCAKALELAQGVFLKAVGLPSGAGFVQVLQHLEGQRINQVSKKSEMSDGRDVLRYDDMVSIIEMRRATRVVASN